MQKRVAIESAMPSELSSLNSNLHLSAYDFFLRRIFILHKETNLQKNYIPILQNLYTHTMEMQYIIYMQEAWGPPHIDHYRSKLCSLYIVSDQL